MAETNVALQNLEPLWLETAAGTISGWQYWPEDAAARTHEPLTLLLHGAGGGAGSLKRLGQLLAVNGPLLIPDLQGYGKTQLTTTADTEANAMDQHCQVIDALLTAHLQPGQSLVIIGHSMGGFVGLRTALRARWPLTKLAVIEPVAFSVLQSAADKATQAEDMGIVLALESSLQGQGASDQALARFIAYWNGVPWEVLPPLMQQALLQQKARIGADALAVATDKTPPAAYRALTMPVLLLQGELSPPPARAVIRCLGELVPQAQTVGLAGVGHMGVVQQPAVYAPVLNTFNQE